LASGRSALESPKRPCPPAGRSDLAASQRLILIPEKITAEYFLEKHSEEKKISLRKYWDKFWFLMWKDNSLKGWIFSILFLFIFVKTPHN